MSELDRQAIAHLASPAGRQDATRTGRVVSMAKLKPQVKLQIDLPDGGRIGPGKIQLLEMIESEGSLSRAAEAMGISYRRAWQFMQQVNAALDEPAIATPERGNGGSAARLTKFGRELIAKFRALEASANSEGQTFLKWIARHERVE